MIPVIIKALIFLVLFILVIQDLKHRFVSSRLLYLTLCMQIVYALLSFEGKAFLVKIAIAVSIFFIAELAHISDRYMGSGDIIFLCGEIIFFSFNEFVVFWFSSLISALLIGVGVLIVKRKRDIPFFPFMFLGHLCVFIISFFEEALCINLLPH